MGIRNSEKLSRASVSGALVWQSWAVPATIFCVALCLAGCAAPGVPITRRPAAAKAITDLAVHQEGNGVVLTFTLPKETLQGKLLAKPPEIEIYRAFSPASVSLASAQEIFGAGAKSPALEIPSQMVAQYRVGNQFQFRDALTPADVSTHAGENAIYMVRARISRHDSADSNLTAVPIFPAPLPIQDLRAEVTQSAIKLSWTTPPLPSAGALQSSSIGYRIFRSSNVANSPANASPTGANAQSVAGSPSFRQIAETASSSYSDTDFKFGETYAYYVVSVAQFEKASVESEESAIIVVTPRDTFAPQAPQGLVAALVSAADSNAPEIDLSWAISEESGVAGYNVYRSVAEDAPGTRLNGSLLLTPIFRDISASSGHKYFYRVTAVDGSGNESAPSAPVAVTVPATNK
ncbi:MAG: hypothetical protein WBE20_15730 [Candidatus Acidiferrales bacterium]